MRVLAGPLFDFQLTVYCICTRKCSPQMYQIFVGSQVKTCQIFFYGSPRQKIQLTLSHICISVLVLYQHDDLFGD